ncbi:MAG: hypothetical protein ACYTGN_18240 [Planctomycetota bacterium]|jgi:hypothetical protein
MRIALAILLGAALMGGLAAANAKPDLRSSVAGPGFIQDEFLTGFKDGLSDALGDKRCGEMLASLAGQDLEGKDVVGVMNGTLTKSQLKDFFGAKRSEIDKLDKSLDESVKDKDQRFFFGIMFATMVGDFDVDPTGEFCKQALGAKDAMTDENWDKLLKGNVSKNTLKDCFGFSDKEDLSFMQEIVNGMKSSGMFNHPMCESMGLGDASKMRRKDFPRFRKGNAGHGGNKDGKAGGLNCDLDLPPCPFMGSNMDELRDDKTKK